MVFPVTKRVCLTVILGLWAFLAEAQINIPEFLGATNLDPELEILSNQISYLNKGQYRLSLVRGVELRTQNNQFGSGEHQYGFRVNPANPWEVKYTNRVFRTQQATLALKRELLFKELLEKRYQLVNSIMYLNQMRAIRGKMLQNTENQVAVLERQKASSFFDAEDYVELKLDQMEEQVAMESFGFEMEQKFKELQQLFPTASVQAPDWAYSNVISLSRLEILVDSLLTAAPLFTTRLEYQQEKKNLADYEYALQKANINPGFFQTDYRPYRFTEKKNPMGISMGVNIPLFNPNKADMAEKKLNMLEAQSELAMEKKHAGEEVQILLSALKNSLLRYQKLDQKVNSYNVTETLSAVNALTNNNPLITLKFNAQVLKLQKVQLELKKEIYQTYIRLLAASDLLNQKPMLNFLSSNLQPL